MQQEAGLLHDAHMPSSPSRTLLLTCVKVQAQRCSSKWSAGTPQSTTCQPAAAGTIALHVQSKTQLCMQAMPSFNSTPQLISEDNHYDTPMI